jgi:hypothetical protein
MALALLLLVVGTALGAYGVMVATERRRPLDVLGALLAAAGLGTALLGAGRLLSERFFSG